MTALSVADERFDAVVALYSIIHVPLDEQPALFRSIFRWLKPGGLFLAVLGDRTWTGTEEEWIQSGTLMYWSHADATTYRKWLQEVGFAIHEEALVSEGDGAHVVFFAKKEVVI